MVDMSAGPLEWKRISETYDGVPEGKSSRPDKGFTYRAQVPGGWLVAIWAGEDKTFPWGGGLAFVPDPTHAAWEVEMLDATVTK